jgi:hypothetical protein
LLHPSQVETGLVLTAWDGQNEEDLPSYNQIRSRSQHLQTRDRVVPLYPIIQTNAHLIQHLAPHMMPSDSCDIEKWGDLKYMVVLHDFDERYGSVVILTNNRCGEFVWKEWNAYGSNKAFVVYTDGSFGDIANGYAMLLFGVVTLTHEHGQLWTDLDDDRRSPKHHFQVIFMGLAKSESGYSYRAGFRAIKK